MTLRWPLKRGPVGAITLAGFVALADLVAIQALLPQMAADLGTGPASTSLISSAATIGLATAVIPWSWAAHRWGHRRALGASLAATIAVAPLVASAPTPELLVAARFLHGVALAGVPALALSYATGASARPSSSSVAGAFVTSTIVGGMTGRLVAGQVADAQGWRSGLAAVAIITAIASIAIARGFPEVDNQSAARRDPRGVPPAVWALACTAFLLMGGFFTLYTYAGFHLTGSLGVSTADASWVFMCYGMGLVAAPLAGRLAARVNRLTLFVLGSATTIAGAVTTLSSLLPIVVAGFAIATAGFFFAHTTAAGWVAAAAGGGPRASALYALAYYSGAGLCAWLAGYVFESAGWGATVVTVSTATVCACACAYVAARLAAGTHDVVAQTQATSPPRRPR